MTALLAAFLLPAVADAATKPTVGEIDHIVPLDLGGWNAIANLYPERAPGYHAKDRLEDRLHALVCAHRMLLRVAQRGIATNWIGFYRLVLRSAP